MSHPSINETMRRVLESEAQSILDLIPRLNASADRTIELLAGCSGRVIAVGMGKMGSVARKAAATLSSTGTPAIFLQPSEALHGDLGIVTAQDVALVLSHSGETEEILRLLPYLQRASVPIVALTGSEKNSLARAATVVLNVGVQSEADAECPAPTCSTTAALAMCDAVAVALMRRRGLTREQFAIFHPGGNLGRKLLLTVGQLMRRGENVPTVPPDTRLREAIVTISKGSIGAVFATNGDGRLQGILTDGDLRRIFQSTPNPLDMPLSQWMIKQPHTIAADALAAKALRLMEDRAVTVLPVVDEQGRVTGAIHLHDLLQAQLA